MRCLTLLFTFVIFSISSTAQLSWLHLPNFPGTGKVGVSSFALNGKGYMGLGFDSLVQGSTDWFEYDAILNTWTQKSSFPAMGRWGCVNLEIGNKGYVITGSLNGANGNETWEYDPLSNAWTSKANFPGTARQGAAGFSIGNKGYVGTGFIGGASVNDFYEYDALTDSWAAKANFPGAIRNTAAGFGIAGKGYMGLGTATNSLINYNDFYEYNPTTDSWTQKADFPITYIDAPTTYSSGSDGYVLCGYYYQNSGITHNPLNTLYSFDPIANVWSLKGTFCGLPRGYAGGFSITNDLYIGAGAQSNDGDPALMLSDFWKLSNGLTLRAGSIQSDFDFIIYPNPTVSTINFKAEKTGKKISRIRIYDAAGKLVIVKSIKELNQSVDVSFLQKGIYFVELITKDNKVLDSRFLKE